MSANLDTSHIFQFFTISAQNLNILPQNGKFQLGIMGDLLI